MNVVLLEPLATRIAQQPESLFSILARVVVHGIEMSPPGGSTSAALARVYDDALDITRRVRTILSDFERATPIGVSFPAAATERALAPFARARVEGSRVSGLVDKLTASDSDYTVELSGFIDDKSHRPDFDPRMLESRVIAEPLAQNILEKPNDLHDVIVQLNTRLITDRTQARDNLRQSIDIINLRVPNAVTVRETDDAWHSYTFLRLSGEAVAALVELDRNPATGVPSIFRVWEDHEVHPLIVKSIATVKADAAQSSYSAMGAAIVWAVIDSGIDASHPHFHHLDNLRGLPDGIRHRDFTVPTVPNGNDVVATIANSGTRVGDAKPYVGDRSALRDEFGHGTHVAGIIGGVAGTDALKFGEDRIEPTAVVTSRDEAEDMHRTILKFKVISGMAPECKLVSYKVLDAAGVGATSSIIEALVEIRKINELAGKLLVHGVNLSIGYTFDAEWFACGASPLCQEVDRLVRSGVVVVCAAGNSGYGKVDTLYTGRRPEGLGMSINDPGNAELAVTVGSVHRDAPHTFGVSYFSSKGPTGDGRRKPDLVAPGEKIISCASLQSRTPTTVNVATDPDATPTGARIPSVQIGIDDYQYKEDSGTSMAAPHVSGVIAGFLSIRSEYVGKPELVKKLFMDNATDLLRDPNYQGAGLVDQMRVISSI